MLSAHELKMMIESKYQGKASLDSLVSAGFHKCVWKGRDHRFGVSIVVKAVAVAGDEVAERERIKRLTECLDRAAQFPHVQALATLMDFEVQSTHTLFVFKAYGKTLRDVMNLRRLHPLPSSQIKGISFQLLSALRFLHGEDVAHTDIKPDNIVLEDDTISSFEDFEKGRFVTKYMLRNISVKLIDYDEFYDLYATCRPRHLIGTSIYRSPEVVLRMPWSTGVDIFAFGCTIAELYLGRPLFPYASSPIHQLAIMEKRLGRFPLALVDRVRKNGYTVFTPSGEVHWTDPGYLQSTPGDTKHISLSITRPDLLDLIKACLDLDDARRCSAKAALHHRYFRKT